MRIQLSDKLASRLTDIVRVSHPVIPTGFQVEARIYVSVAAEMTALTDKGEPYTYTGENL